MLWERMPRMSFMLDVPGIRNGETVVGAGVEP